MLSNHDQPRHRTRYGSNERARAAAFLSLAQRSTPYLYAGEELGLGDATIPAEAVVDPGGRDGCRAPIPWSADALHGWGPEPWLPFTDDATTRSFATQDTDPDSILALYRRLLQRRSSDATLSDGAQQTLDLGANVVAWSRTFDGRRIDIAINMGTEAVEVDLQGLVLEGSMRHDVDFDGALAPDEAVMIEPR
ncbi:MAG: alpha-glucosidase [Gammaproteobacteria bacterium]